MYPFVFNEISLCSLHNNKIILFTVEDVEHAIPKAKSVHNISRQAEAIWSQLINSYTDAKAP